VLSPTRDDKGDYLRSQRSDKDDQARLKRIFFETYLETNAPNEMEVSAETFF
jgi:hypothetical protein